MAKVVYSCGVHENDWMFMSCRYPGVGEDSCATEDSQAEGKLRSPGPKSHAAAGAHR